MDIRTYLKQTEARFEAAALEYGHGTACARDEAVYLVYSLMQLDFSEPIDSLNQELDAQTLALLDEKIVARIEQKVPMAYLLGEAWFAGLRFRCDERALVPRSPIAELIANDFQPLLRREPARILDLCAGGGCIGIACALQFPRSEVVLADNSEAALALAQENIELHGLTGRVRCQHSDLFASLEPGFDLIVCNPPYVSGKEMETLPVEYRHEPRLALFSPEEGLALPLAILARAQAFLNPDGLLIMEVGLSADRLQARVKEVPLLWLDFEEGGEGVFALTAAQLAQYRDRF